MAAARPDPLALVLLFRRGYAEVEVVGLLFLMNAIGSLVVVLALVVGRAWIGVLGALSICVPSLVSIAISHSPVGFLGFRESGRARPCAHDTPRF